MAVAPFEIITGPADVWVAPVGTVFPVINVAPGGAWSSLGYTDGGIRVGHPQDMEMIYVDQLSIPVKIIRTTEGLNIAFTMVQLTLERYAKVMNDAVVTTTVGPPATKEFPLYRGPVAKTLALLVRGPSPYGDWNMQYQVPLVIQSGEPETTFVRDDKAGLATEWMAVADLNASDANKFGKLLAQSA